MPTQIRDDSSSDEDDDDDCWPPPHCRPARSYIRRRRPWPTKQLLWKVAEPIEIVRTTPRAAEKKVHLRQLPTDKISQIPVE